MTSAAHVMLLDDDYGNVTLITELLGGKGGPTHVHAFANGAEAMAFLRHEGQYASAPSPHLIVLNLDCVRADGEMVLKGVKSHPSLRQIPVVVLSKCTSRRAVANSYRLGANSYVMTPTTHDDFVSTVTAIKDFWLGHTQVPH